MTRRPPSQLRHRLTAAAVAVALVLAPGTPTGPATSGAAAQSLPDLGDAAQTNFSAAQERKLGETIIRQLRANGAYINDPEVNDYLNELGHRLVAASKDVKQDFEFFGVPDPQVNAFALPGGYIGVHTGLILLTQSESELAAVLAHEITHVTQHHMARALSAQKDSMSDPASISRSRTRRTHSPRHALGCYRIRRRAVGWERAAAHGFSSDIDGTW